MAKNLRKGISQDQTYIAIECQCINGVDTDMIRFLICEETDLFLGYGTHVRTPDFTITIKGNNYACFYVDSKTIKIPYDGKREYDGLCYIVKQ